MHVHGICVGGFEECDQHGQIRPRGQAVIRVLLGGLSPGQSQNPGSTCSRVSSVCVGVETFGNPRGNCAWSQCVDGSNCQWRTACNWDPVCRCVDLCSLTIYHDRIQYIFSSSLYMISRCSFNVHLWLFTELGFYSGKTEKGWGKKLIYCPLLVIVVYYLKVSQLDFSLFFSPHRTFIPFRSFIHSFIDTTFPRLYDLTTKKG